MKFKDYQKYKKYKTLYKNLKCLKGGTLLVPGYPYGFRPKPSVNPLQNQQNIDQYNFYVKLCECISIIRNDIVPIGANLRGNLEKYRNSRFRPTNRNFTPSIVPSNPAEWANEISHNFRQVNRNNNPDNLVEYRVNSTFLRMCFEYLDEYGNFVFDRHSPHLNELRNLLNQLIFIRRQGRLDPSHLAYVQSLEGYRNTLDQIFAKPEGDGWYDLRDGLPTNTKPDDYDRQGEVIMEGQHY